MIIQLLLQRITTSVRYFVCCKLMSEKTDYNTKTTMKIEKNGNKNLVQN